MARLVVTRGTTEANDFEFDGSGDVGDPSFGDSVVSFPLELDGFGGFEVQIRGSDLHSNSRLNPSGTVTSLAYIANGKEILKLDGISSSVVDLFDPLQSSLGFETLLNGDDNVVGSDFNDILTGFRGRDSILGGFGEDALSGEDGDDMIYGGGGDDRLFGGFQNDVIFGGPGRDQAFGDEPVGLTGSAAGGNDTIYGEGGRDDLRGDGGDDHLHGGGSRDKLDGGHGDDTLIGDRGRDVLYGGDGEDSLNGGAVHDTLFGGGGDDELQGLKGGDQLFGGDGADVIRGGRGLDRLSGGEGEDRFVFRQGDGNDRVLDFKIGEDLLDLSRARQIEGFEDLLANHSTMLGDDALITFKDGSVRLFDIDIADLSETDFIF